MEIPFRFVVGFIVVFAVLAYVLYNTSIDNTRLKCELAACKCGNTTESMKSDDKVVPDRLRKKESPSIKSLGSKAMKAYAQSNNLEEIPKFL